MKHKRIILVAGAMVFLVLLFLIKTSTKYENQQMENGGLVFSTEIIGDLVIKDTDLDGTLDWEEGLWGTDPTKKDSDDDGVLDSVEIEKLKTAQISGNTELNGEQSEENLTETDKFSRELFSTVATLNQAGVMDEATVEQLGSSLAEQIQNSAPRKVFVIADIQTTNENTLQAIQNYSDTLDIIYKKYPINKGVNTVLQEFLIDEENVDVDVGALSELTPIINQLDKIVSELIKVKVPQSIAFLHIDFVNGLQRLSENLADIKLYETDVIITLSAISQYEKNLGALELATNNLSKAVNEKLTN